VALTCPLEPNVDLQCLLNRGFLLTQGDTVPEEIYGQTRSKKIQLSLDL
jgi:hypothetical protein